LKLTGNNLVIVNILATYVRIVLVAGMGLFSVRWVLQALGSEDFGLYSVVGGLIVFILFIGGTMSSSVQRFYAYAIGQGDPEEVKKWFNTAFSALVVFSCILVIVGVLLGNYLIKNVMIIPPDRLSTCLWVYYLSIFNAVGTLLAASYMGMFTAKQRIFELSFWNVIQTCLAFALAWYLLRASGDLLLFFALGMVGIKFLTDLIQIARGIFLFRECRLKLNYWFNKKQFAELFAFITWDLFGGAGYMVRNQGTALLINIFFGPQVNAAYGVANQVAGQTQTISRSLQNAIAPEITTREGAGNRDSMITLSLRTSKFAVFLTYMWLIPLYMEVEYVLALWLTNVPEYAAAFCRIILLVYAVSNFTIGCGSAVFAKGRIKGYQLTLGTLLALTFPLMWVALKLGASPVVGLWVMLLTACIHSLGRVYWMKRELSVPYSRWVNSVLLRSIYTLLPVLPIALILLHIFPTASFGRLFVITATTVLSTLASCWFIGFDKDEQRFIQSKIMAILGKFCFLFPRLALK
jgi:O-antigen/teichoic acid export membrane protein